MPSVNVFPVSVHPEGIILHMLIPPVKWIFFCRKSLARFIRSMHYVENSCVHRPHFNLKIKDQKDIVLEAVMGYTQIPRTNCRWLVWLATRNFIILAKCKISILLCLEKKKLINQRCLTILPLTPPPLESTFPCTVPKVSLLIRRS